MPKIFKGKGALRLCWQFTSLGQRRFRWKSGWGSQLCARQILRQSNNNETLMMLLWRYTTLTHRQRQPTDFGHFWFRRWRNWGSVGGVQSSSLHDRRRPTPPPAASISDRKGLRQRTGPRELRPSHLQEKRKTVMFRCTTRRSSAADHRCWSVQE